LLDSKKEAKDGKEAIYGRVDHHQAG